MKLSYKDFLKHYITSIAFRFSKAIESTKDEFNDFEAGNESRTPIYLLNHISRLTNFTFEILAGNSEEEARKKVVGDQLTWIEEKQRIIKYLKLIVEKIDEDIYVEEKLLKKLIQGPISDIMTHIGQLAMLRRLSGDPMPRTYYFDKMLETGKINF